MRWFAGAGLLALVLVAGQTCHGPIERLPRVGADRLGHFVPGRAIVRLV